MLKFLAIPLAIAALSSVSTGKAIAGGCGGCSAGGASNSCAAMPPVNMDAAPAATTDSAAARVPTRRTYSYQPSAPIYRAPMMRSYGGTGFRDAGSKVRGDYGR